MFRKAMLDHHGQIYGGTIRNISATGALVEGLCNVPVGTIFKMQVSAKHAVTATTRWCTGNRIGLEFAAPLDSHSSSGIEETEDDSASARRPLRKAG
jgi:hypothetical protein